MKSRPNVVMILVDDMGYGDLGLFNDGLTITPRMDALAGESVAFSQAYCASPVCNPSRAALLTGRYPMRTGSVDTLEWHGLERLALQEQTLGDLFTYNGYVTGLIGKWHLGAFDGRYHPRRRGFKDTVCFRGGMHDYYDWRLEFGEQVVRSDGTYLTDLWTKESVDFLNRHKNESFFLHVTYNAPHTPLQVPHEELGSFSDTPVNSSVKTLYAMLKRLDTGIGHILDTLTKLNLEENTIVLLASDNGPQFDNGHNYGGADNNESLERFNCNLHGAKGTVYEGGIKVPMMLRWPAGLRSQMIDDMVHFVDIYPTLSHLCSLKSLPNTPIIDGIDISPLLDGQNPYKGIKRFWQWNRYEPVPGCNIAVRDGDWKLVVPEIPEAMEVFDVHYLHTSMYEPEYFIENGIFSNTSPHRNIPASPLPELYNITDDPGETCNRAIDYPERVETLLKDTEQWFTRMYNDYKNAIAEE